ncbi:MAG TPA: hypothetical protein VK852_08480 [Desulfobacterales bacterium]|jgi:hypothetical protein|nr:hypothetical protein [Desulfobacterales bacterium]
MSLQPQGEQIRKAVKWISTERTATSGRPLAELVAKAGVKFDLSPAEEEYLLRFFTAKPDSAGA